MGIHLTITLNSEASSSNDEGNKLMITQAWASDQKICNKMDFHGHNHKVHTQVIHK